MWEHKEAYEKVRNREKACVNCEHAFPYPYPRCQLVITCMRGTTESVWDLDFDSALDRFRDSSLEIEVCKHFKQRKNPELFLRRLVWIKRFMWFLCMKLDFDYFEEHTYTEAIKSYRRSL